ncbi:periplasmic binding protein-like I [Chytridium lagenaria]|nr:periplasmic binding protein-like I [Chytridium lagenaria]
MARLCAHAATSLCSTFPGPKREVLTHWHFVSSHESWTFGNVQNTKRLPGGTPVDAEWVQGILEILDFRMEQLRANQSLHPSVRNISLFYDEIPSIGETLAIRSAFNLFNRGVIAVIGAGYSSMTLALAPVMDAYNIPVCDGASTSPKLSSRVAYPNFFRPIPQDNGQASAIARFLKQQGWSEVAILAAQDGYGQNLANELMNQVRVENITVTFRDNFVIGMTDYSRTVMNLRDSLSRIIVFIGNSGEFVTISQQAQAAGIFAPGYAWITADGLQVGLESYSPNELQSINGVINVFPTEGQGVVYESFKQDFFNANVTRYPSIRSKAIQPFHLFYVNCLEAFVFGFDRLFKQNPAAVPTTNADRWNLTGFKIPETINFPDRDTVTGRVIINEEGDRVGSYKLTYYEATGNRWIQFGEYGVTGLIINGSIMYVNGSTTKPLGSIRESSPQTIIQAPNPAAYTIFILTPVSATLCFACMTTFLACKDKKTIRSLSVELSVVSILGLVALSFYPLSLTGEPTNVKCVAEIWVLPLSITLTIATQLCKNFRVYRVFANKFVGLSISNGVVMGWILGILAMDMIISIVWTAYDSPKVEWDLVKLSKAFELQSFCTSADRSIQTRFLGFEYGFHAVIFILGIGLATFTRHLPPQYNQSSELTYVMYAFIAIGSFVVALLSTVKLEKTSQVIIKALGSYLCVWLTLYNLFWSKFVEVYKDYSGKHKFAKSRTSTLEDSGANSSLNGESSAGAESVEKASDFKLLQKTYPVSELCYVREKTTLGIVTWTPYVVAVPSSSEVLVYLFSSRSSIQILSLFASDWIVKIADNDPSVPKKEPFHAIKLTKTLQSIVSQPEIIIRFKEAKHVPEWLQILVGRAKVMDASLMRQTSTNALIRSTS